MTGVHQRRRQGRAIDPVEDYLVLAWPDDASPSQTLRAGSHVGHLEVHWSSRPSRRVAIKGAAALRRVNDGLDAFRRPRRPGGDYRRAATAVEMHSLTAKTARESRIRQPAPRRQESRREARQELPNVLRSVHSSEKCYQKGQKGIIGAEGGGHQPASGPAPGRSHDGADEEKVGAERIKERSVPSIRDEGREGAE